MGKGLSGVSSGKGAWCSNCALMEKKVKTEAYGMAIGEKNITNKALRQNSLGKQEPQNKCFPQAFVFYSQDPFRIWLTFNIVSLRVPTSHPHPQVKDRWVDSLKD